MSIPRLPDPLAPLDPQLSARVGVTASGAVTLNGAPADVAAIEAELQRLKASGGTVYYYREAPQLPPHPVAERVFGMILDSKLTLVLISTPDLSAAVACQWTVYTKALTPSFTEIQIVRPQIRTAQRGSCLTHKISVGLTF